MIIGEMMKTTLKLLASVLITFNGVHASDLREGAEDQKVVPGANIPKALDVQAVSPTQMLTHIMVSTPEKNLSLQEQRDLYSTLTSKVLTYKLLWAGPAVSSQTQSPLSKSKTRKLKKICAPLQSVSLESQVGKSQFYELFSSKENKFYQCKTDVFFLECLIRQMKLTFDSMEALDFSTHENYKSLVARFEKMTEHFRDGNHFFARNLKFLALMRFNNKALDFLAGQEHYIIKNDKTNAQIASASDISPKLEKKRENAWRVKNKIFFNFQDIVSEFDTYYNRVHKN